MQVEYAVGAIKLGSTAIGIQTKEGVVLASERRITSCLLEPQSIQKIAEIDSHIACAMSVLIAGAWSVIIILLLVYSLIYLFFYAFIYLFICCVFNTSYAA